MEYRCLIAGDVVAEPRMLLQRLLGQPLTEDDRRHLRHRSLRDVLLCRATHTFPVTQTHAQENTPGGAEKVINSTGALTVSTGQNNTVQGSSTRAMGPFTLTMPNPSMPSVDITILLDLVESPEELEAILRPELPAHGPLAALARAHLTKRQRFHAAHAILLAFNPFSHDSVDRARFAWTAALRRCRGAVSASGLSREFSLQTQQSSHDALLYANDDSNGHVGRNAMASSRERYHGNMSALSLYSPSLPVVTSPTNAMSWVMPMHSNSNNNNNIHLVDSAAMSGDVVAFGEPNRNVSGPTVLLVGTRFDLLSQAIGATPTVMPPAASTLAELAAGLSACLYFEVADTWPERLAELRTRLAQACVGELQERVLHVRAEDVMRVRQASMQRAFHELHLSEQDHTTTANTTTNNTNITTHRDGSEAVPVAPEEHRAEEEELAVSFAWSAQLSFAAPSPTSMTAAAAAMTDGGNALKATGLEATAIAAREAAVVAGAQSSPSPHAAAAAVLQSETSAAYTTDTTAGRSVWTWRRHPRTGRIYFVHRPTRHTQYTRPPDYDGREPTIVSTVAPSNTIISSNDADKGKATSYEMKSQDVKSKTSKTKDLQLNKVTESFVTQRAPSEALAKAASSTAPSSPATTVLSIIASTPPTAAANGATAQVVRTLLLSSPTAQRMSPLQMGQAEEGDKSVASPQRALCAAELRARLALLQELERMCDTEWDRAINELQRDVDTLRNRCSTVEGNEPKASAGSVGGTSKDTSHAIVLSSDDPSLNRREENTDVTQSHKEHDTRVLYDAAQLAREESTLCAEEQAAHEALRAARWKYEVWSDRLDTQCLVAPYTSTTHQSHYDPTMSKETVTTTAGEASGRDVLVRALCDGVTTLYNLQQLHDTLQRTQTSTSVAEDAVPAECVQHLLREMHEAMERNVQDTAALVVPEALSEPWQRWLIQALQVAAIELATHQQQQKSQCATRASESALSSTTSPSLDVSRYGGVIALDALQARRVVQEQKMSLWCALRAAVLERSEHKKEKSSASDGFCAAFARHVALLEAAVDSGVVST